MGSKIISLKSENVKRLVAVEIKPNGELVVLGGKNGAGKSSVIDSIEYAKVRLCSICGATPTVDVKAATIKCPNFHGAVLFKRSATLKELVSEWNGLQMQKPWFADVPFYDKWAELPEDKPMKPLLPGIHQRHEEQIRRS